MQKFRTKMSEPTEQIFGKSKAGDTNVGDGSSLKPESDHVCRADISERAGDNNSLDDLYGKRDVVAEWQVLSHGKLHKIEFEHGTTSGKRVLWIDGQVINQFLDDNIQFSLLSLVLRRLLEH